MVYGAALEKRSPILLERGFESHPLRHRILFNRKIGINLKKMLKQLSLKFAVPLLILTGFLIPLGHQLIIIMAGAGLTLEHRLNHGRWWDRGKLICHGRAGVLLLSAGACVALSGILH